MIKVKVEITARSLLMELGRMGIDCSTDHGNLVGRLVAFDWLNAIENPKRDFGVSRILQLHGTTKRGQAEDFLNTVKTKIKYSVKDVDYIENVTASTATFTVRIEIDNLSSTQWREFWTNRPTVNVLEMSSDGSDVVYWVHKDRFTSYDRFSSKLEVFEVWNAKLTKHPTMKDEAFALNATDTISLNNVDVDFGSTRVWFNNPNDRDANYLVVLKDVRIAKNTALYVTATKHSRITRVDGQEGSHLVLNGVGMPKIDIDNITVPNRTFTACRLSSKKPLIAYGPSLFIRDPKWESTLDTKSDWNPNDIEGFGDIRYGMAHGCILSGMNVLSYKHPPVNLGTIARNDSRMSYGDSGQNENKFEGCTVELKIPYASKIATNNGGSASIKDGMIPLDTLSGCKVTVNYPEGYALRMIEMVNSVASWEDDHWEFMFNSLGRDSGFGTNIRGRGDDPAPRQRPNKVKCVNAPSSVSRVFAMRQVAEHYVGNSNQSTVVDAYSPIWLWECTENDPMGKPIQFNVDCALVARLSGVADVTSVGGRIVECTVKHDSTFSVKDKQDPRLKQSAEDSFRRWVLGGNVTIMQFDDPKFDKVGIPQNVSALMKDGKTVEQAEVDKINADLKLRKFCKLMGCDYVKTANMVPPITFEYNINASDDGTRHRNVTTTRTV